MNNQYNIIGFATEVAFKNLVEAANKEGVHTDQVLGLSYLPDPQVARQFKEACTAVLKNLGVNIED